MLESDQVEPVPGGRKSLEIRPDLTLTDQACEAIICQVQNAHHSAPVHGQVSMFRGYRRLHNSGQGKRVPYWEAAVRVLKPAPI